MSDKLEAKATFDVAWGHITVYLAKIDHRTGERVFVTNMTLEQKDEGSIVDPSFHLEHNAAVQLMDDLWRAGIRPSDGEGSVGQIGAVKDHLNDMRALVFGVYDKGGEG